MDQENGFIAKVLIVNLQEIMNVYFSMLMVYIVKKSHLKLNMK